MKRFIQYINEASNEIKVSIDLTFETPESKKEFLNDAKKNSINIKLQSSKYADYEGILIGPSKSVFKFLSSHGYSKDEYTVL